MDQATEMRVFVRAMERGGFTAAAEDVGLTPSAVSKLVSRLEDRLGVRLLNRTTRRLSLTPEGETYLERARTILEQIAEAEAEVTAGRGVPRGRLRVNCGVAFAHHHLIPALPVFLDRHPEVELDLSITDRVVDLVAENADVAIRAAVVTDGSLVARRFADIERVIVASPDYLARHGTPQAPEDLRQHNCLFVSSAPMLGRWPFRRAGELLTIEVAGRVRVDDAEGVLNMALAGVGIARVGDWLIDPQLRASGRLVTLFEDIHHVERAPLSAVYPAGRHRAPKVRAFVDFLVETFGPVPWRCSAAMTPA